MRRVILAFAVFLAPQLAAADKPVTVNVSGLSADAPAGWKSEKPANLLRSHQFKLPTHDKDHADAELIVSPKASPDVTKNFDTWKAQYTPADGVKPEDAAKTKTFEVGGAKAHVLDVTGTWKYRERPRDPTSKEELRPEFRTVWVILVGKDETTHLRLSGHQSVVEKHHADFEKWLKSLK
jgi:hypothetical protein